MGLRVRIWLPLRTRNFSLLRSLGSGSRAYAAFYPMGAKDYFRGGESAQVSAAHSHIFLRTLVVKLHFHSSSRLYDVLLK
jgi:hypothetical protein